MVSEDHLHKAIVDALEALEPAPRVIMTWEHRNAAGWLAEGGWREGRLAGLTTAIRM